MTVTDRVRMKRFDKVIETFRTESVMHQFDLEFLECSWTTCRTK